MALWPVDENIVGTGTPGDIVLTITPDVGVGVELSERLVKNPDDVGLLGCMELC